MPEHRHQYSPDVLIQSRHAHLAICNGFFERPAIVAVVGHFLVEARTGGSSRRMSAAPVAHDPSAKVELLLEKIAQHVRVLTGVDAVGFDVRAHEGADSS